jgi:hypothetical protein
MEKGAMAMKAMLVRWIVVSMAVAAFPAAAQVGGIACQAPALEADPLLDRTGALSRYEQLPRDCLQAIFHRCSSAAGSSLLDFDSAANCSIAYEAFLKQGFAGDFRALLAWWRTQRSVETTQ